MKQKLIPAMIGAALAGGMTAATADVTVFGHIDTSIVNYDYDGSGPNRDDTRFQCTTCSIGFKGSEDLGNGLKAIFSLDFEYDTTKRNNSAPSGTSITISKSALGPGIPSTTTTVSLVTSVGSPSITDRDQWLGLAGGFGKVRIGTISTGYKSHGAAIDPLYRSAAQGRDRGLQSKYHSGAGEELQGRATNTARWDSPNWNGLNVVAHYTLDSNEAVEDDDPFGIGASYENGGILVFADYMDANGSTTTGNDESVWKLGGKFSMDNFAVYAQYEDGEDNNDDFDLWHIAGSATFGSNMVYVGYGQGEYDEAGANDTEHDAFTIAGTHSMSKSTTAYAAYSSADCDPRTSGGHVSHSACSRVPSSGGDNSVFALGLQHKF